MRPPKAQTIQIKRSETEEQIAVADYLNLLGLCFAHIPNEGKRTPVAAAILKRMGMKPGFPDLLILEPRGKYHGLAIEMKSLKGRASADQKDWLKRLHEKGYATALCYGADAAIQVINKYRSHGDHALGEYHDEQS